MPRAQTALKKIVSRLDGVVEGVACAGTKLESKTYCVGGRAFLFVSASEPTTIRFKVASLAGAAKRAGAQVGAGGWSRLLLDGEIPAGLAELIAESHALMGGGRAPAKGAPGRAPRKAGAKTKGAKRG